MYVTISTYNRCSVRLYLRLLLGELLSYLRYLCLFAHCCVQHILCCVFVLSVFVLCTLCCQCLGIVFLRLVYPMLPVSRDCLFTSCVPYVARVSGMSFYVLCTLCCPFLGIVFLRLVYPMLPVSWDCPFLIATSVFTNVLFKSYAYPKSGINCYLSISTGLDNKIDDFNFPIVNFPHIDCNKQSLHTIAHTLARICSLYSNSLQRHRFLNIKLLNQWILTNCLTLSFKMLFGRYQHTCWNKR